MKKQVYSCALLILCLIFLGTTLGVEAGNCNPSGKLRGKKPPPGQCNQDNDSDCCVEGRLYTTYNCSPPVSRSTKATLTLNCFEENCDGGAPSECDNQYHSDDEPIGALSTGWYNKGSRCLNDINIQGAMEGLSRPRWLMNVTLQWVVMLIMITNLPALIALWMPQKQSGRPWGCRKVIGGKWIFIGPMPNYHVYI